MRTFHGTVVDIAGAGVLLRGLSGCGKSDLALRLIDRGATLVADDQCLFQSSERGVVASAPSSIYGLLEIRGLGIQSIPAIKTTVLRLVVDLVPTDEVPRLPEQRETDIEGKKIANLMLNAFEYSAPVKIELATRNLNRIGNTDRRK